MLNSTHLDQSICSYFEQQVAAHPDQLAVVDESSRLTYAQLNAAANRIARAILLRSPSGCEPIALLLGQGALAVTAILGVLKTGRIYTRLDPAIPSARTRQMLEDSQAQLLVTDQFNLPQARTLLRNTAQQILCCDNVDAAVDDSNLDLTINPEAPALILYTSGSTGRPKGVLHTHQSILVEIRNYARDAHPTSDDAMSLCTSMSFAMSVRNLYGALLYGAALLPYDLARRGFAQFSDWIERTSLTMLYMPPTAFRSFCETLPRNAYFPKVRVLRIAGEPLSGEEVRRYRHHFRPDCMLYHGLGPTEAFTVVRNWVQLSSCDTLGKLPIGEPLPDKEVLLLDDLGIPTLSGEVGNIVVRSKYLALGYWRNPSLTDAVFLADASGGKERLYKTGDLGMRLPNGQLMHVGRKDSQVKIRGHRIEMSEIELALRGLGSVRAAAVDVRSRDDGERALIGYVVPADDVAPSVSTLRHELSRVLPDYMIPPAFVFIRSLPTLPNGKVDRHALPAAPPLRPLLDAPFALPRTSTETQVANIWAEILSLDSIGIYDPFLELGGDSLQAARILARITDVFNIELPLTALFETLTVAGLSERIDAQRIRETRAEVAKGLTEEF